MDLRRVCGPSLPETSLCGTLLYRYVRPLFNVVCLRITFGSLQVWDLIFFFYLFVTAAFFFCFSYQSQRTCAWIIVTIGVVVTVIISGLCFMGPSMMIMAGRHARVLQKGGIRVVLWKLMIYCFVSLSPAEVRLCLFGTAAPNGPIAHLRVSG